MKKVGKLIPQERDTLAILLAQGVTLSEIARKLSRSKSTISDEVKRNRRWDKEKEGNGHHSKTSGFISMLSTI